MNTETFTCSDSYHTSSITANTPEEAAEAFCSDFDSSERSVAYRVVVSGGTLGEEADEHIVVAHPPEPRCDAACDGQHRWQSPHALVGGIEQNPGVWGTGGASLRIEEVCVLCGTKRVTTTPNQGFESEHDHTTISYEEHAVSVDVLEDFHGPEGIEALVREGVLDEASDLAMG
ncbi:MAG: hypothetical protein LAT68_16530 [Cyclobacteriaceae bacterium]|nr:hypothetical protein [Cyclobacteriaceae bacterium]